MRHWFAHKQSATFINKRLALSKAKNPIGQALTSELKDLDQKISKITKELMETEFTAMKLLFSSNKGWFGELQKNWYRKSIKESSTWSRERLLILYKERRNVQIQLDKLNGYFWQKRIGLWLAYIGLGITTIVAILILFMGLMSLISLIPVLIITIIIYSFFRRKSNQI